MLLTYKYNLPNRGEKSPREQRQRLPWTFGGPRFHGVSLVVEGRVCSLMSDIRLLEGKAQVADKCVVMCGPDISSKPSKCHPILWFLFQNPEKSMGLTYVYIYIFTYMKTTKPTIHVGKYTSPMDRQGRIDSRSANKNMSSQKTTNVCCLGFSCSLEVCKMHRGTQEGVFGRQANAERLQQVFGQAFGQQQRSQRDDLCPWSRDSQGIGQATWH